MLKEVSHKNIIALHDFISDEENGIYIIITEYFPSVDLKTFIASNKLSSEQKIRIFNQILVALYYLHKMNIIHGDLNVNNILINPETEEIKIVDFGLSRKISDELDIDCISPSQGRHAYRPPDFFYENWLLTDLWGLLLVFYSLCENTNFTSKKLIALLLSQKGEEGLFLCKAVMKTMIDEEKIHQLEFGDFEEILL